MDEKKAIAFYTGQKKLKYYSDLPQIEPYFFKANNFIPDFKLSLDYSFRNFMLNKDKTLYYFATTYNQQKFNIRRIDEIQSVDFIENDGANDVVTNAMLFGSVGAALGATDQKSEIKIRLRTTSVQEPIIDLYVLSEPLSPKSKDFIRCFGIANNIYGIFRELISPISTAAKKTSSNNDEEIIERIRRYKELLDDGILTSDEFEAKKKQLLGL